MGHELIDFQMVSVAAGDAAEPGEFTQYLRAAYWRHADLKAALAKEQAEHQETQRLLARAQQENAQLQKELAALRAGEGVAVMIEGKKFFLSQTPPETQPPPFTMNQDWLTAGPATNGKHDTQRLDGSLVAYTV